MGKVAHSFVGVDEGVPVVPQREFTRHVATDVAFVYRDEATLPRQVLKETSGVAVALQDYVVDPRVFAQHTPLQASGAGPDDHERRVATGRLLRRRRRSSPPRAHALEQRGGHREQRPHQGFRAGRRVAVEPTYRDLQAHDDGGTKEPRGTHVEPHCLVLVRSARCCAVHSSSRFCAVRALSFSTPLRAKR